MTGANEVNETEIEIALWDKTANLKLAGRHVGLPAFLESLKLTGSHGNPMFKSADDMSDAELKAALLAAAEKP